MHTRYEHPDFAPMVHVPDMESFAYNQKPKAGYKELRLMRYVGTDLYQWYGIKSDSIFEEACDAPVQIKPIDYSIYAHAVTRLTQDAERGGYSRPFAQHQADLAILLGAREPSAALLHQIDETVVAQIGDNVSDCIDGHDWSWDTQEFTRLREAFMGEVSRLLTHHINVPDALTAQVESALQWLYHGLRNEWSPDSLHLASSALDNANKAVALMKAGATSAPVVEDGNEALTDAVVAVAGILLQTGDRVMDRKAIGDYATNALTLLKALRPQLIQNQTGDAA